MAANFGVYSPFESTGTTTWISTTNSTIGGSTVNPIVLGVTIDKQSGIAPQLFFKYMKSKFGVLEKMNVQRRIAKIEKAFDEAAANGQDVLAGKFLKECVIEMREAAIAAKGFRYYIEQDDIQKHKRNIRGGHISDTRLEDFTRIIPKDVLAKKKKSEGLFDSYIIYHYWNEKAEKNVHEKQKMTSEEKAKMRDPVLFGRINETNRLYFVADWEDEFCDLTFDEMVEVLGKDEEEIVISRESKLASLPLS